MSATDVRLVDIEGPIKVILRRANREFDQKIMELSTPEQVAQMRAQQSPAFQLGVIVESFNQALTNFARMFSAGQRSVREIGR